MRPLQELYQQLVNYYGPQSWWPAGSRFEVMVGAILTQNTSWKNVERALHNLKSHKLLRADKILALEPQHLAEHIRPSGYYNVKSKRLANFCNWYIEQGEYRRLRHRSTEELRIRLLALNGIGAETADDILLYAFDRASFVIDAYTRRILTRLGLAGEAVNYEQFKQLFETQLSDDVEVYKEYHALLVEHAKRYCRKKPLCDCCALRDVCPYRWNEMK